MGKWSFIMNICKKFGLNESYELAEQIKNAMIELYGDEETEDWSEVKEYWNKFSENFYEFDKMFLVLILNEVIHTVSFCKACVESEEKCRKCKFAKKYGDCYNEKSLFRRFVNAYKREAGIMNGETFDTEYWSHKVAKCIERGNDNCLEIYFRR